MVNILLSLVLLLFIHAPLCYGALQINTSVKPPFSTTQKDGFFDLLLEELFARVGVEVDLVRLPAERALQMVNGGLSDGDVPRIAGLTTRYSDLIMVEEPVADYFFVAFTNGGEAHRGICERKFSDNYIGLIIGWKIYENMVPEATPKTSVSSATQLFQLLNEGRIDIALYERYAGSYLVQEKQYDNIEECSEPLAVRPMYLYLHKRHKEIGKVLAEELKAMKIDGSWQRIVSQTLEGQ